MGRSGDRDKQASFCPVAASPASEPRSDKRRKASLRAPCPICCMPLFQRTTHADCRISGPRRAGAGSIAARPAREGDVEGRRQEVGVDLGGQRLIKNKKKCTSKKK